MEISSLRVFVETTIGEVIEDAVQVAGGKNNQIFELALSSGRRIIAKCYLINANDSRDRCGADFSAHTFLWTAGCRSIAQPLGRSDGGEVALYSLIKGNRPVSLEKADIDQAVAFVKALAEYSLLPEAQRLSNASEASFNGADLVQNLKRRLTLLEETASQGGGSAGFRDFVLGSLRDSVNECCAALMMSRQREFFREELPLHQRILSPSDFGFHNALRDPDGEWRFLDFEYFGWDDPAKLVCDFQLHPAMGLSKELSEHFKKSVLAELSRFDTLCDRAAALMPCYKAKWSMIMLNEFHREHRKRREFSMGSAGISEEVLSLQLAKAQQMLVV